MTDELNSEGISRRVALKQLGAVASGAFFAGQTILGIQFPLASQPVEGFSSVIKGRRAGEYLAMPDNGFGWHTAAQPPTSDEFVAAQGSHYHHMIESFGASRCMFESNFPVDRMSLSYRVLWNAFKKITSDYSSSERAELFAGTATRVYHLAASTT